MLVEVVDVGADVEPVAGQRRGVDARPGDDDHAEPGHEPPGLGGRRSPAGAGADARAADRHDADPLAGRVAELGAEPFAVAELAGSNR